MTPFDCVLFPSVRVGRLKMREWKMRYGQNCKGGKCRSGKKTGVDSRGGKCRSKLYGAPTRVYT